MTCIRQKEMLLSLIETYRDMPYLWQRDNKDYLNKNMREQGFGVLLEIYQGFDEHATVKVVKKKIENMRTNYFKELRKVVASEDTDEVYVPSLWYYDALSFLANTTQFSREEKDTDRDEDPLETVEISLDYEDESITSSARKRMKIEPRIKKQHIPEPSEKPASTSSTHDDEWEVYGRAIGYQVKDLSERQLVICQKLISDAIFYGKFNKLNADSHIVNPSND